MVKTINASDFTCSLKGLLSSLCASVLTLPITAWALTRAADPQALISVLPKLIAAASALLGGIVCAGCGSSRPILASTVCGVMLFVLNTSISLAIGGSLLSIPLGILGTILPAILGGLIGMPKEKSAGAKRRALIRKIKR